MNDRSILALSCTLLMALIGCQKQKVSLFVGPFNVDSDTGLATGQALGIDFEVSGASEVKSKWDLKAGVQSYGWTEITLADDLTFQLEKLSNDSAITFKLNGRDFGNLDEGDKVVIDEGRKVTVNGATREPEAGQSPAGNGKPQISTSEQASIDVAKEHELVVRPVTPISKGGKDPEALHLRYNLTARHGGKLLVRVREPLLATEPPLLGRVPGFISTRRAPWAEDAGSHESDGLAQQVLELSDEDVAAPLAIEVRMVHPREPEEMVRVHLWLYRGDKGEPWLDFYQCRPATKTNRSSNTVLDREAVMDSGVTTTLCHYNFGGDTSEVEVPLNDFDMQSVVVELGWKSSLDHTQ